MNRTTYYCLIVFVLMWSSSVLSLDNPALAEEVQVETAIAAASDNLDKFVDGKWVYQDYFVYYNLDNLPSAYAIVFRRFDETPMSWDEVSNMIRKQERSIANLQNAIDRTRDDISISGMEKSNKIEELRLKMHEHKQKQSGHDSYATLITGASNTEPVVIQCHSGLPMLFVNRDKALAVLQKENLNNNYQLSNYIYLGVLNELYLATSDRNPINSENNKPSIIVDIRTNTISDKDSFIHKYDDFRESSIKRMYADENKERIQSNMAHWAKYIHVTDSTTMSNRELRNKLGNEKELVNYKRNASGPAKESNDQDKSIIQKPREKAPMQSEIEEKTI